MPSPFDTYLGIHPQALKVSALRSEVLAANMANADTPGYKAQDVDFKTALAATQSNVSGSLPLAAAHTTHASSQTGSAQGTHIALSANSTDGTAAMKYRVPLAPSLDGNTVDSQVEQANFAQNAIRYQASLSFLNGKFRSLMTAITGQ
ncbi:MAG: flagellar basal body rod protein FlgB [Steroidobacteraceae bacterium]